MYRKNVAGQFIYFQLNKTTDGTALTGATVVVRRCIDGTFAAGGGTVTEDTGGGSSPGFYRYALAQADTNGNDIGLAFTATGAISVEKTFVTTAADPTDGVRFGLTALPNAAAAGVGGVPVNDANSLVDVDVKRWLATAVAATTAGIPDVNTRNIANAAVSTTTAQVGVNVVSVNAVSAAAVTAVSANVGTTQPVNFTGTGGAALVKSDVVDIGGAPVSPASAQLGVNVLQINSSALAAVNVGLANQAIGRGICAAGGTTTTIPTSTWAPGGAGVVTGQFTGRTVIFDAATATIALQGQASNITTNTAGATPAFTVTALTTAPSSGDTFMVV